MENNGIQIIDRGRGPQLSTSRITVQDLVPCLQQIFTHDQIKEVMPILRVAEIRAIQQYVKDNYAAVMEQDRRIRLRSAARQPTPEAEATEGKERQERLETARLKIRQKKQA